jgi:hypothetical protein
MWQHVDIYTYTMLPTYIMIKCYLQCSDLLLQYVLCEMMYHICSCNEYNYFQLTFISEVQVLPDLQTGYIMNTWT